MSRLSICRAEKKWHAGDEVGREGQAITEQMMEVETGVLTSGDVW